MTDDRSRRIQDRAYALWEHEGRPHGRHEEHWRQAEQEASADEAPPQGAAQLATDGGPRAQAGAPGTGGIDAQSASTGSTDPSRPTSGAAGPGDAGAAKPRRAQTRSSGSRGSSPASPPTGGSGA